MSLEAELDAQRKLSLEWHAFAQSETEAVCLAMMGGAANALVDRGYISEHQVRAIAAVLSMDPSEYEKYYDVVLEQLTKRL